MGVPWFWKAFLVEVYEQLKRDEPSDHLHEPEKCHKYFYFGLRAYTRSKNQVQAFLIVVTTCINQSYIGENNYDYDKVEGGWQGAQCQLALEKHGVLDYAIEATPLYLLVVYVARHQKQKVWQILND